MEVEEWGVTDYQYEHPERRHDAFWPKHSGFFGSALSDRWGSELPSFLVADPPKFNLISNGTKVRLVVETLE